MSGRAAWLTIKMHRFEVLIAVALLALMGVSAWVVAAHMNAVTVGPECWSQWEGSVGRLNACQQAVERWLDVHEHESGQLTGFMGLLPAAVGVVLGVPIVARELELRTVSFAWSLQGIRWRWLLSRLWPLLVVAIVGGVLVGFATTELRSARLVSPFEADSMGDIARQGPVLLTRVLIGFGVGLLAGSLVGRTLPAFLVAGLLVAAWIMFAGPTIERSAALSHVSYATDEALSGGGVIGYGSVRPLDWLGEAYREPSGRIMDGSVYELACPGANTSGSECPESPFVPYEDYERMAKIVPQSAWGSIEQAETGAGLLVAGLAILLTFPVVARRRAG